MVNPEIINSRLREIDENITILIDFKSIPLEKFSADPKIYKAVERCLQVAIQCILDIAHHLIIENEWPRPEDNKETILTLGKNNVVPPDFAERIQPMAGLRNLLVHEYIKIKPELLYNHLQNLDDFREFQRHIVTYLKRTQSNLKP